MDGQQRYDPLAVLVAGSVSLGSEAAEGISSSGGGNHDVQPLSGTRLLSKDEAVLR